MSLLHFIVILASNFFTSFWINTNLMLYFEAGFVVLPGTTSSALLTVGLVTGLGFGLA
jgi:hypothetical protein